MDTLFYITNFCLLLAIMVIVLYMYNRSRGMNDELFQLRRRSFIAFYLLLAFHVITSFDIVTAHGIEVFATMPICTLYFAFITFTMLAAAYYGRNYYRNFPVWFFLLQYPAILLLLHLFMRFTGRYARVYSINDILYSSSGALHVIVLGRTALLAVLVVCFLFMIYMLIDAYRYYCKQEPEQKVTMLRQAMRHDEILNIWIYSILLLGMLLAFMIPSYLPHIIMNILMTSMIGRTYYVYNNFRHYSEKYSRKLMAFSQIKKEIVKLTEVERNNPIYLSNSNLEDVAAALKVERQDFSDFLYEELNTTFPTWMSDKKITHFVSQLLLTDRKISELAEACGYANVTSLNRAFKNKYGKTPSEYRLDNQHERSQA